MRKATQVSKAYQVSNAPQVIKAPQESKASQVSEAPQASKVPQGRKAYQIRKASPVGKVPQVNSMGLRCIYCFFFAETKHCWLLFFHTHCCTHNCTFWYCLHFNTCRVPVQGDSTTGITDKVSTTNRNVTYWKIFVELSINFLVAPEEGWKQ